MSALPPPHPGSGVNRPVPAPDALENWPICEPDSDEPPASMTISARQPREQSLLDPGAEQGAAADHGVERRQVAFAGRQGFQRVGQRPAERVTDDRHRAHPFAAGQPPHFVGIEMAVVEDITNCRPEHRALKADHCAAPCIRGAHGSEPGPPARARCDDLVQAG